MIKKGSVIIFIDREMEIMELQDLKVFIQSGPDGQYLLSRLGDGLRSVQCNRPHPSLGRTI